MVKIEEVLKHIPPKSIVMLEVPAEENPMKIIADFLRFRQNDGGIYISSNRPTNDLISRLQTYKFDLRQSLEAGKMFIVDLVSKSVGASETKGSFYVASPSELSATQMAVEKAVENLNGRAGDKWLLLDSVSTLLVFNSSGALLTFLHFLISRLRVLEYDGIIFAVEGSLEQSVLATASQFCDEMIKL
jgi:KaiC/GvpD/RAD55 family RecA-like ATPase